MDESTINLNDSQEVDKRAWVAKKIALSSIALGVILTLISLISSSGKVADSSTSITDSENSTIAEDNSWIPNGYTVWINDSNIAWTWVDSPCGDSYGCVNVSLISKDGCPNGLYAAANWLDSDKNAISYDNATLPSLRPLQKAKLRFDDIEGTGKTAQIAEINCR